MTIQQKAEKLEAVIGEAIELARELKVLTEHEEAQWFLADEVCGKLQVSQAFIVHLKNSLWEG